MFFVKPSFLSLSLCVSSLRLEPQGDGMKTTTTTTTTKKSKCVKTVVCTETNNDSAKGNRVENLTGQQWFGRGELWMLCSTHTLLYKYVLWTIMICIIYTWTFIHGYLPELGQFAVIILNNNAHVLWGCTWNEPPIDPQTSCPLNWRTRRAGCGLKKRGQSSV